MISVYRKAAKIFLGLPHVAAGTPRELEGSFWKTKPWRLGGLAVIRMGCAAGPDWVVLQMIRRVGRKNAMMWGMQKNKMGSVLNAR